MGKKDKKAASAVATPTPAKLSGDSKSKKTKKSKAPPPPPSSSSSSESESESDSSSAEDSSDEEKVPVVSKAPKANGKTNGKITSASKKASSDESSSGDSSSSDDAAPTVAVSKTVTATSASKEETSDSESDESSDDSDSDSEVHAKAVPPTTNGNKAKNTGKEDSSDSESESGSSASDESSSSASDSEDGEGDVVMKDATSHSSTKRKAEDIAQDTSLKRKKVDAPAESQDQDATNIFVGNLSWNVDNDWLKSEFESYGEVVSARVQVDRNTGRSRGFGYVEFSSASSASAALQDSSKEIDGRAVRMDAAPGRSAPDPAKRARAFNDTVSAPSSILFVGNLAFDCTEDAVWEAFGEYGEVLSVRLPTDRETQARKGFGYVEFSDQAAATKAFEGLKGRELSGRAIRLDYSHPKDPSASNGPPRGRGGGGGRGRGGQDRGRGGPRGRGGFSRGRGQGAAQDFKGSRVKF